MQQRLTKSSSDKVIDGVAGGIAEYFGVDPVLVRLVFLLLLITSGGTLVLVYIALMVVMPSEEQLEADPRDTMRTNLETMGERIRHAGEELSEDLHGQPWTSTEVTREEEGRWDAGAAASRAAGADSFPAAGIGDLGTEGTNGDDLLYEEPWQAEVRRRAERAAGEAWTGERHVESGSPVGRSSRSRQLGLLLIGLGAILLANQVAGLNLDFLPPLLVIGVGAYILLRRGGRA